MIGRPKSKITQKFSSMKKVMTPSGKAPKKNPLMITGIVLGVILVLFLFVIVKSTKAPSQRQTKPGEIIQSALKPQVEIMDNAASAINRADYDTLDNLVADDIKDINAYTSRGETLLITAAAAGNIDAFQLLLSRSADVNKPASTTGDTPVMAALKKNHRDMVVLLIQAGADLNMENKYGQTPLLLGIATRDASLVRILISRGAVTGARNEMLISFAAKNDTLGVDTMLRLGIRPELKDKKGYTPLMMAASLGNERMLTLLLSYHAKPDTIGGPDDSTALIYAAKYNKPKCVELLMAKKADINIKNKNGETALYWAAYNNMAPVVDLLLSHKANPKIATNKGKTPFAIATDRKRAEVLKVFAKYRIKS
ncbi:Ankyrin repeat [Parelusimicrobium proximum]|uniref:ankyrin repeat domain-containing protein n=1 Tax=Parelusimicrobium proximum TaxID=3228953 RepID=UPI003D16A6BC